MDYKKNHKLNAQVIFWEFEQLDFFLSNPIKIWGYSSAISIHINETKVRIIPKQSNFWLLSH